MIVADIAPNMYPTQNFVGLSEWYILNAANSPISDNTFIRGIICTMYSFFYLNPSYTAHSTEKNNNQDGTH